MSHASWLPVDAYGWVFDLIVGLPMLVAFLVFGLLVRSAIRHKDAQRAALDARLERMWRDRHVERVFRLSLRRELRERL